MTPAQEAKLDEVLRLAQESNGELKARDRWNLIPRVTAVDEYLTGIGEEDELVARIVAALPSGAVDVEALAEALRPVVREELDRLDLNLSGRITSS